MSINIEWRVWLLFINFSFSLNCYDCVRDGRKEHLFWQAVIEALSYFCPLGASLDKRKGKQWAGGPQGWGTHLPSLLPHPPPAGPTSRLASLLATSVHLTPTLPTWGPEIGRGFLLSTNSAARALPEASPPVISSSCSQVEAPKQRLDFLVSRHIKTKHAEWTWVS